MDPEQVLSRVDRGEYPWTPERHGVDRQHHKMAYLDEGDGPPVVLVHGNPTWSYTWRNFVKTLRPRTRCIAPDHIGFGCSDKPRDPTYHSLERHIRNLTSLLRHLELDKVTLVLADWGGPVGLGWATRNPEKVERLVLLNTWAMRSEGLLKFPLSFRLLRSPGVGEILIQKHNLWVERFIALGMAKRDRVTETLLEAYRAPFPFPDDRAAILRFMRMVPMRGGDESYETMGAIEAGLERLDVPVQLYWGARDQALTPRVAEYFADLLPQASREGIVTLPDVGHFVQEDAHEVIAPRLLGSLS